MIPGTYQHERVPGGGRETPPAGHGSTISTCFARAIHGAQGHTGEGQGL
jgi:hypothetical protein